MGEGILNLGLGQSRELEGNGRKVKTMKLMGAENAMQRPTKACSASSKWHLQSFGCWKRCRLRSARLRMQQWRPSPNSSCFCLCALSNSVQSSVPN